MALAFLGPTDPEEIATLLTLGKDEDAASGTGRYGGAWRLPLSHEARARLGDRLAALGDTRTGVAVGEDGTPCIDWVAIPGGEIEISQETGDSRPRGLRKWLPGFLRGEIRRAEQHCVEVVAFHMSRYPVTNAQFKAFAQATDGYRSPDWWRDMPADANDGPKDPRWSAPNRSRETVSWYEAVAFCRWLSDRLGFEVRLPTELEWQNAATDGDPRNVYPWGPEWDADRCNTSESGLERTVAVGMYPAGASAQGIHDLAGNVFEWCLNKYDTPSDEAVDGSGDGRVLRGGSWSYFQGLARAAFRLYRSPDGRFDYYGFRVVCASPIR
jgi:formylglycine-generating enzyme required for sulfatase activity